jgi:DNA invertase Pin-like site-specific DNA recombinase/peptidoglycan hydrolase-like protein with peptidoglycan-binding domain
MRRTYGVPLARAGLGCLLVTLLLLGNPGTSIAGGASESTRGAPAFGGALLQRGAGYGAADGSDRVRALQRALRSLGWRPGPVDGLFGPRTEGAVTRLQQAAGLRADGVVGPKTRQAIQSVRAGVLRRGAGYARAGSAPRVRKLQRELRRRGLRPGPVDGRFGPRTEAAVARLQRAVRLPATGVVNTATRRLLAGVGVPARVSRTDSTREDGRRRELPALPVGARPDQGDGPAAVPAPLMGAAVAAALAIGVLLALLLARRDPVTGMSLPLAHGVLAEGFTRSIGRFRGQVHALVLGRRGLSREPDARDLVSDENIEQPFWVAHHESTRLVSAKPARARAARAVRPSAETVRVVGYVSVPRADEPEDARLRGQVSDIHALCEQRGWRLVEIVRDVEGNHSKGLRRPGLQYALDRIEKGDAHCLVVSHLGRLTRSAGDLSRILERFKANGGRLVAMNVRLDTGSSHGDIAADALMSVAGWERQRLGEQTRKGLAAARARGVAAGRPAVSDVPALKERIVAMRSEGRTLQAIADQLNAEGVPTVRGGEKWRPSSVQVAAGYRRPSRRRRAVAGEGSEDDA